MSATLKLTRAGIPSMLRFNPAVLAVAARELRRGPFEIQLDGMSVGSVERDETVEKPLKPGHHTLRIRSGRYFSHDRSFDVKDGEVVSFRTRGALGWPTWAASLVKPDLVISLKHA